MQNSNGLWHGFNSVVLELGVFQITFDKITWIGSDYSHEKVNKALLAIPSDIRCIALPVIGGKSLWKKLISFPNGMLYAYYIFKELPKADIIHVRGPNAVMFIAMLIAPFFKKKKWWFKYATNWVNQETPFFRGIQKLLMRRYSFSIGTINGNWPHEPNHIKTFENPCITETQLSLGSSLNKDFYGPFKLVFAGRLESAKGIDLLIDSLASLPKNKINEWVFIGDGPLKGSLKTELLCQGFNARVLGFVSPKVVHEELKEAHFLILPSRSEGFPKVIAEAWNYGCIPISSAVGSIPHYLDDGVNGFIISKLKMEGIAQTINKVLNSDPQSLDVISKKGNNMAKRFTFEHYLQHLKESVFGDY